MKDFLRSTPWPRRLAAIAAIGIGVLSAALAGPYRIAQERWIEVEARAFLLVGETNRDLGATPIDVPPSGEGSATIGLPSNRPATAPDRIEVAIAGGPAPAAGQHRLVVRSRFVATDGTPVKVERVLELRDGSAGFFEAGHGPGWRLTLALTPNGTVRPVARPPEAPGLPVVFRVEVGRLVQGRYVPLERNDLSTFRGQPVEYSFRLGHGDTLEQLRLVLTPRQIEDDLAEVGVQLTGSLHAGRESPLVVSRTERWFTGRGTTSELAAAVGDPPEGFRFRVTPQW